MPFSPPGMSNLGTSAFTSTKKQKQSKGPLGDFSSPLGGLGAGLGLGANFLFNKLFA
jgi:hypothetical protein